MLRLGGLAEASEDASRGPTVVTKLGLRVRLPLASVAVSYAPLSPLRVSTRASAAGDEDCAGESLWSRRPKLSV